MKNFGGIPHVPYIGALFTTPSNLCERDGYVIPISINWNAYTNLAGIPVGNAVPSLCVDFEFTSNAACSRLSKIKSVYIDNTDSNVPIFVCFPDTGFIAVAAPNIAGWYPVFTNQKSFFVCGDGFVTNQLPQTFILISDTFIPPYSDAQIQQSITLFKSSQVIQGLTNPFNGKYAAPALADQLASAAVPFNAGASQTAQILPAQPLVDHGFYYVGNIQLNGLNFSVAPGGNLVSLDIIDNAGNVKISAQFVAPGAVVPFAQFINFSAMQLKWDATKSYILRSPNLNLSSGSGQVILSYCYSLIP